MADTIFALSSGSPPAAIAIVRISGPLAGEALRSLAGHMPTPRYASLRTLHGADQQVLDRALVLWFPGPATATGEDLAELHLHGGRAVVTAVLNALAAIDGCRMAEPGEFTKRALANGVIDLLEAEGLADLLHAETEIQRRVAVSQAEGAFSRNVERWRTQLLEAAAMVESLLDYADEDDVALDEDRPRQIADAVASEVDDYLRSPSAERLRDGARVVLGGPPNSGKSSLFNVLVARDAAIVTEHAGTTRDLIEVPLVVDGLPIRLVDTAGIREAADPVERIGVARTADAIGMADIVLWLGPLEQAPAGEIISISAKCDVVPSAEKADVAVSIVSGSGIAELRRMIAHRVASLMPKGDPIAVTDRQRSLLLEMSAALHDRERPDLLLFAEALRAARVACDRLTGRAGVDDLLDVLFARFCLGK